MDMTFNQLVHSLVGLVKYAVALVLLVAAAKILPGLWGNTCYLNSEDMSMRQALGKTTMKVAYDPTAWNEADVRRGDIVVLMRETAGTGEDRNLSRYPFRVIAVEGDLIEAHRGAYKINGKQEEYPGVKVESEGTIKLIRQRVPRGYMYIMPDDRRISRGGLPMLVPVWQIVGKIRKV